MFWKMKISTSLKNKMIEGQRKSENWILKFYKIKVREVHLLIPEGILWKYMWVLLYGLQLKISSVRETSDKCAHKWIEKFDFGNLPVEDQRTMKNEWRTMKNGKKSSRNCPQKRLGSVMEAPQVGFSSRKQFFSLILSESQIPGRLNEFVLPSPPYL